MPTDFSTPKGIQLHRQSSALTVTWSGGDVTRIEGRTLRQYCACSACRSRKVIGIQLVTDSDEIERIELMGSTGIQIVFADGHDKGVFPWGYLRAIADGRVERFL